MRLNYNLIGAILFWTPIFLLRIFLGGEAVDYSVFPSLPLQGLGYITNTLLLALALLRWQTQRGRIAFFPTATIALGLVLFLQYAASCTIVPKILPASAMSFLRGVLWAVSCLAYAQVLFQREYFIRIYLNWAFATGIIALGSLLFWRVTGLPVNVLIADGAPRIQGMLSEPSALAYACAPAAGIYFYQKRILHCGVLIAAIALSYSVIAVATSLIVLGLVIGFRILGLRSAKLYMLSVFSGTLFMPLLLFFSGDAARISTSLLEKMPNGHTEGFFRERLVERTLSTVILLDDRLNNPSDIPAGPAERLLSFKQLFKEMNNDAVLFSGYGLNVFGRYWISSHPNSILDYGIIPFNISSFGIVAGTILILSIFVRTYQLLPRDHEFAILIFGFLIATSYNSAGGLLVYSPLFVIVILGKPSWANGSVPRIQENTGKIKVISAAQ